MFYKVKIWSAEDCTQRQDFYVSSCLPYVNKQSIQEYLKANTVYQVSVVALPPKVQKLKSKYRLYDLLELGLYLKTFEFFTHKWSTLEIPKAIAYFYKNPFITENAEYKVNWYTFFKYPSPYVKDLETTIEEIIGFKPKVSVNGHYYLYGKYTVEHINGKWTLFEIGMESLYTCMKCKY